MPVIKKHPKFDEFFSSIKDARTKSVIAARLDKMGRGLMGDVAPVGDGVQEARIDFGPGWRVYFIKIGSEIILLLGGGSKHRQQDDINAARKLARSFAKPLTKK